MKKGDLKVEEETRYIVRWWNGEKWLVKETCNTQKEADDLKQALEERKLNA